MKEAFKKEAFKKEAFKKLSLLSSCFAPLLPSAAKPPSFPLRGEGKGAGRACFAPLRGGEVKLLRS
jgi:hypothetical protein